MREVMQVSMILWMLSLAAALWAERPHAGWASFGLLFVSFWCLALCEDGS